MSLWLRYRTQWVLVVVEKEGPIMGDKTHSVDSSGRCSCATDFSSRQKEDTGTREMGS